MNEKGGRASEQNIINIDQGRESDTLMKVYEKRVITLSMGETKVN